METGKTTNKILAYIRVSTLTQAEDDKASLDVQRESIKNFIKAQGGDPRTINYYTDTLSGQTTERESLQRLLKDAQEGSPQVVVWALSRLGRSAVEVWQVAKSLQDGGASLRSVTEPIDTSNPYGKAMMQMLAILAELEITSMKERMVSGRYMKTSRDGTNFGSEAPFGYKIKDKRYEIVEEEANIVRLIFELYRSYKSMKRVVLELKQRGVSDRIKLDGRQIGRILKNPKYAGRMKVKNTIYGKRHDAIIADGIFQEVQEIRKANYQGHIINWSLLAKGYWLRDILSCGHCGADFVKQVLPASSGGYKYYVCATHRRGKKHHRKPRSCANNKRRRKEKLEELALTKILDHIKMYLSDEAYLRKHLNTTSREEISNLKTRIQGQKKALKRKKRARTRLLNFLEDESMRDEDLSARLKQVKGEIKSIEDCMHTLRANLQKERNKSDEFKERHIFYKEFKENWEEADDQEKRDMINCLVRVAYLNEDNSLKIEYNF